MNNLVTTQQTYVPALGGFFSWLKRAVQNVVNAIVTVSYNPTFVFDILEDLFNNDGSFNVGNPNLCRRLDSGTCRLTSTGYADIPLTPNEEAILDNWVNNNFTPFKRYLSGKLKQLDTNSLTIVDFVSYYNEVQLVISALEWYQNYSLSINELGLTQNAKLARNQFIDVQIGLLQSEIQQYMLDAYIDLIPNLVSIDLETSKYLALGLQFPQLISVNSYMIDLGEVQNPDQKVSSGLNRNSKALPVVGLLIAGSLVAAAITGRKKRKLKS